MWGAFACRHFGFQPSSLAFKTFVRSCFFSFYGMPEYVVLPSSCTHEFDCWATIKIPTWMSRVPPPISSLSRQLFIFGRLNHFLIKKKKFFFCLFFYICNQETALMEMLQFCLQVIFAVQWNLLFAAVKLKYTRNRWLFFFSFWSNQCCFSILSCHCIYPLF